MDNIEKIIKEFTRKGYSLKEIAENNNIKYEKILSISKKMKVSGELTDKDFFEGRKNSKIRKLLGMEEVTKILEYKEQGLSNREIVEKFNGEMDDHMISYYIHECISTGLIDKDKILAVKGDNKRLNTQKQKILSGLRGGLTVDRLEKKTQLDNETVMNIINEYIEKNEITQEEIDRARILTCSRKGKSIKEIAEITGLSVDYIIDEASKFIKKGMLKQETICEEVRKQEKYKQQKEEVLKYLKKGHTTDYIEKATGIGVLAIRKITNEFVADGSINRDELIEKRAMTRELEKTGMIDGKIEGIDEYKLISYLKLGYDDKQIKQKMGINTAYKYNLMISKLIYDGKITQDEIDEAKEKRKEDVNTKKRQEAFKQKRLEYNRLKQQKIEQNKVQQEKNKKEKEKKKELDKEKQTQLKEKMKDLNKVKILVDIAVRTSKKLDEKDKQQIREYIDICLESYKDEKITKSEIEFLEKAMKKISIESKDVIKFVRVAIYANKYLEALEMLENKKELKINKISEEDKSKLSSMKKTLRKACKIETAIQTIKNGNTNSEVISKLTGLETDDINILKLKLLKEKPSFLAVSGREKIIGLLLKYGNPETIQRNAKRTDLEMEDILDQAMYRRRVNKTNEYDGDDEFVDFDRENNIRNDIKNADEIDDYELRVKQDSTTRIIALLTKIGQKPEYISKILGIELGEVNRRIKDSLNVGLMRENQLDGVDLLKEQALQIEELMR